jgi:hypothetical protein
LNPNPQEGFSALLTSLASSTVVLRPEFRHNQLPSSFINSPAYLLANPSSFKYDLRIKSVYFKEFNID